MDCTLKDFYIMDIYNVTYIDQRIYSKKYVEYKPKLYWDELMFFNDCIATINFDNQKYNVEPNDILFLPSGSYSKYTVTIQKPGDVIDIFLISNIHLNTTSKLYKSTSHNTKIDYQQILTTWQQNPTLNHAKCMSILWDIIHKINKEQNLNKNQSDIIKPAIEYIKCHYLEKNISINKLCALCGVSYSLFLKTFEKELSTTPNKYIINLRMNYACDLLKTDKKITEISEIIGFTDVYFFSKQFKKYIGISPTTYRQKYLQNREYFNKVKPWEKA